VLRVFASNGRCPRLSCPRRVSKNNWSKDGDVPHSLANSTMSPPRGRNRSGNRRLPASTLGFWPKWSIGTSPPKDFPLGSWRSVWRPKFASEPADSVRLHGIDGHCNLIGPLAGGAFERPLFKAASAGRNSRQGHPVLACRTHWPIADKLPITVPQDHRRSRTWCPLSKSHWKAFSSAVSIFGNGRSGSRLIPRPR
jgi:hypothetical protein